MTTQKGQNQEAKTPQKTQAQLKAEKRAAALRDNLKKRKALKKDTAKE